MSSSFSRSSSPLSDVDSASSSPAPNTPPPIRSPSLVFSSPDPSGPANQDEEDDELAPAATTSYFDPSSLPTAPCLWGDCNEEFWELEPFIDHLHNVHAFPVNANDIGTKKALIYVCDWTGCPRRGKNQTSKFALLGHLRSHTGEKPFNCPRPECDKSFTRTDALQKHMRVQHHEVIQAGRRPPAKDPSKSKAKGRASSFDSTTGGGPDDFDGAGSTAAGDEAEAGEAWTEDELELFEKHPELSKWFAAFVVAKAKWKYLIGEHEGLLGELESFGTREAELLAENEELLKRIMKKEVGHENAMKVDGEGEDETLEQDRRQNSQLLHTFLNNYSHIPIELPANWTGDK